MLLRVHLHARNLPDVEVDGPPGAALARGVLASQLDLTVADGGDDGVWMPD